MADRGFFIVLENTKTKHAFHRRLFWAPTFAEATREAYKLRLLKGHEWRIKSVSSDDKCRG